MMARISLNKYSASSWSISFNSSSLLKSFIFSCGRSILSAKYPSILNPLTLPVFTNSFQILSLLTLTLPTHVPNGKSIPYFTDLSCTLSSTIQLSTNDSPFISYWCSKVELFCLPCIRYICDAFKTVSFEKYI